MKFIFINKDDSGFTEYNLKKIYVVVVSVLLIALVTVPSLYFFLKYETLSAQAKEDDLKLYNSVYNEYFRDPLPTRSTIVNVLPSFIKFELDCVAYSPQTRQGI